MTTPRPHGDTPGHNHHADADTHGQAMPTNIPTQPWPKNTPATRGKNMPVVTMTTTTIIMSTATASTPATARPCSKTVSGYR